MGKTSSFTATAGTFAAVTTVSACIRVRINEDVGVSNWPTSDLLVVKLVADTPKRIPAGETYEFAPGPRDSFHSNETVGFVQPVSGSTTIAQDEDTR